MKNFLFILFLTSLTLAGLLIATLTPSADSRYIYVQLNNDINLEALHNILTDTGGKLMDLGPQENSYFIYNAEQKTYEALKDANPNWMLNITSINACANFFGLPFFEKESF